MTSILRTLVTTDWLATNLQNPDIRIIDASWYLPDMKRNGKGEYGKAHIPGARFFDIDEISDTRSNLPHMAPTPEKFVSRMRAMGIGDGHKVVIYDGSGLFSAARVWWLFKLMGKNNIAVLDGGFPKWLKEHRAVKSGPVLIRDRHITVQFQENLVKDVTQVSAASKLGNQLIVDARAPGRFSGTDPEPRAGLRSGHIPKSQNMYYRELLNSNGTMKSENALRDAFTNANIDLSRPIITTCGSGITAAIISLALEIIGHKDHSLYDGSWTEWGQFSQLQIETG